MSLSNINDADVQQTATTTQTRPPTIVGIYGISGSGKSYLLEQLKGRLGETTFLFYEGSEQLLKTSNDTLENFKGLSNTRRNFIRARAIIATSVPRLTRLGLLLVTIHSVTHLSGSVLMINRLMLPIK
jgi:ABC-type phosphonate transport system ATPase subunit